jgi:hypothetical protein
MRRLAALCVAVALVGPIPPSWASSESTAAEVGSSAGSAFGTLIDAPLTATFDTSPGTNRATAAR